ncbi:helix-turn-helix domain-containing protein [Streptomyces chilikensis]|uniref:Helix-turn-helix domain-containing protein n=1 Tax=Streptomyces chilikensis TaxID=1194079 RepID=A0ABV3EUW9_9ACTN
MYDLSTRRRALSLVAQGRSLNSVSRELGVSRAAIRDWQVRLIPLQRAGAACERCRPIPGPPDNGVAYSYLLGLYLGDGCISKGRNSSLVMRIACADAWPGLIDACEEALRAVRPHNSVFRVRRQGCTMVTMASKHWACLFPQHGPGRKHERSIALAPWQQAVVDAHPWEFLRGLIHSDGCRVTNWTTRIVGGEPKRYEYLRYFFTNTSGDIRRLFVDTLDKVGVEWKVCVRNGNPLNVSVARKASVALMDARIGPKY